MERQSRRNLQKYSDKLPAAIIDSRSSGIVPVIWNQAQKRYPHPPYLGPKVSRLQGLGLTGSWVGLETLRRRDVKDGLLDPDPVGRGGPAQQRTTLLLLLSILSCGSREWLWERRGRLLGLCELRGAGRAARVDSTRVTAERRSPKTGDARHSIDIEERRDCQREVPGWYDNRSGEHNNGQCCGID